MNAAPRTADWEKWQTVFTAFTSNHIGKHKYVIALTQTLTSFLCKNKLPYILWHGFSLYTLFHFAAGALTVKIIYLLNQITDLSESLRIFTFFLKQIQPL